MTEPDQFGTNKPPAGSAPIEPLDCAAVEVWLAESAENTLPSTVTEQLRAHASDCTACQEKLTQTRHGREWLFVLKQEPLEPPAGIVAKILAGTSLAGKSNAPETIAVVSDFANHDRGVAPASSFVPAWQRSSVVVLRRTLLDPRLALVAAMAFFSISLTLNLMGVRLTSLHAANLKPENMHHAITRQYADANARVARYYENLRIVYEVEARVQQIRRAAATSAPPEQQNRPRKQSSDSSGNSSSGQAESAGHTLATSFVPPFGNRFAFRPAPQASSCSLRTICCSRRYFSARERRLA